MRISSWLFTTFVGIGLTASAPEIAHANSPSKKVAVIVSAGDLAALEDSMKVLEKQAMESYERLGFKVILVGGIQKTGKKLSANVLHETLAELRGVEDLRLDFIGHGTIANVPDKHTKNGIPLSEERRKAAFNNNELKPGAKTAWFAANLQSADSKYYGNKAQAFGIELVPTGAISHEEVQTALTGFRANNPSGTTTINLLNCFSGALAQVLRKEPNTVVFGNSPHNTVALDMGWQVVESDVVEDRDIGKVRNSGQSAMIESTNGLSNYYRGIGADFAPERGNKHGPLTVNDVRKTANTKFASNLKLLPHLVTMVGRSPAFESAIGWCEEGRSDASRRKGSIEKDASGKVRSSEHKTALHRLKVELDEIEARMSYSENTPDLNNPKRRISETMRSEYQKCLKDPQVAKDIQEAKMLRGDEDADKAARKAVYENEEATPIMQMLTVMEQNLSNEKLWPEIIARFVASLEMDIKNLTESGLDESRWGGIRELIARHRSGKVEADWLIGNLRSQVNRARQRCSSGRIHSAPCFPNEFYAVIDLADWLTGLKDASIVLSAAEKTKAAKACERVRVTFPNRFTGFACTYHSNPNDHELSSALYAYWSTNGSLKDLRSQSERCALGGFRLPPYGEYMKQKENVGLDKKCIADFIAHAPEVEVENLNRLHSLGERDARGWEPIDPNSPERWMRPPTKNNEVQK